MKKRDQYFSGRKEIRSPRAEGRKKHRYLAIEKCFYFFFLCCPLKYFESTHFLDTMQFN